MEWFLFYHAKVATRYIVTARKNCSNIFRPRKEFNYMTGQDFLEKLVNSYQSAFDIERSFDINGDMYDAYASFNVSSAKYVLVKKAELWRTKPIISILKREK